MDIYEVLKNRKVIHNEPRLKVNVDGDRIPVSISKNPQILVNKNTPKFSKIKKYIIKYLNVFFF